MLFWLISAVWIYPVYWLTSLTLGIAAGAWDDVILMWWWAGSLRPPSTSVMGGLLAVAAVASWRFRAAGSVLLAGVALALLPRTLLAAAYFSYWRVAFGAVAVALLAITVFAVVRLARTPQRVGSGRAMAGVVATLVLAGGSHLAGQDRRRERDETRRADRERILASLPKPDPKTPYTKVFFQRGVNFTAEGPVGYAPGLSVAMLDQLQARGVNSIALVPYGFSRDTASPEIRGAGGGSMERDDDMEAITGLAHQRGIRVMLKPQIWLGRGGYPGAVAMKTEADTAAWFANYAQWIGHYAQLAARIHADIFCVGVEFRQMARHTAEWRKIIAGVRAVYPGPLTYGATQGEEFESIAFWDSLDYIGLNNYYPLPDSLDVSHVMQKVEAVHRRYQRPVIFPETGYSSVEAPHREPWAEYQGKISMDAQMHCVEALLKAFYKKPWFMGVYWWKVGTNGFGGPDDGSHTPWGKPAMEVIARWYKTGGR